MFDKPTFTPTPKPPPPIDQCRRKFLVWGFTDKILAKTILPFIPRSITPNQITILRFILTPFVLLFLLKENYLVALPLFFLTALTDAIDGAMARTRDQITDWGKIFDPIADKILIGSTVVVLVAKNLNWLIAGLILFFEILIISSAGLLMKKKKQVIQANLWGKIKMILQVVGVLLLIVGLLFQIENFFPVSTTILWLAILFAVISLFSYGL